MSKQIATENISSPEEVSLMEQTKLAAQATGHAAVEVAKLAKDALTSAYDASKELVQPVNTLVVEYLKLFLTDGRRH